MKKIIICLIVLMGVILTGCTVNTTPSFKVTIIDGDTKKTVNVLQNNCMEEVTALGLEGHEFIGWYNGDEIFDFNTIITENITLTAKYELLKLNVEYYLDGELVHCDVVSYGTILVPYDIENHENIQFNGWYLDKELINDDYIVTEDIKLYADVTQKWLVSFYDENILVHSEYVLNGENVKSFELDPKMYQEFLGWYHEENIYNFEMPVLSDLILKAKWQKETINISFDSNGGTVFENIVINKGESLDQILIPTKENCDFLGWYYNDELVSLETIFVDDAKLIAKWGEKMYKINYDLDGGVWQREVKYPNRADLIKDFLEDASSFVGVKLNQNTIHDQTGSLSIKLSDMFKSTKLVPSENITYQAKWAWLMNYLIGVRSKDESTSSGVSYLKNLSDTYSNTYWRYELWAFLNESKASAWPYSSDYTISKNANGYYDVMPGEDASIVDTFSASTTTFELPIPTKNYSTFIGWYDSLGNQVVEVSTGTNYDLYLTARYQDDEYQIIYNLNGGSDEGLIKTFKPINNEDVYLNHPSYDGYAFMGFYYDSEFKSNPVLKIDKGTAENVELYAKWAKETIGSHLTISFYGDSITTYSGMIPSDAAFYYPIYSATVKHADKTWWRMTCEELGLEMLTNISYAGSTVVGNNSTCGENDQRIDKIALNGEQPDILVIYLGINDVVNNKSSATFRISYQNMIDKIQSSYPDTQIFVCNLPYETYTDGSNPDGYNYPGLRESFNQVIEEIALQEGLPLIDLDKVITKETESMDNRYYLGDNIHPSYEGMKVIKDAVVKKIKEFYNK